eukprot:scaffold5771_cov171-Amphora_coffeaeformis.AAC.27
MSSCSNVVWVDADDDCADSAAHLEPLAKVRKDVASCRGETAAASGDTACCRIGCDKVVVAQLV